MTECWVSAEFPVIGDGPETRASVIKTLRARWEQKCPGVSPVLIEASATDVKWRHPLVVLELRPPHG